MGNRATFYHYDLFRAVLDELEKRGTGYTAVALRSRKTWHVDVMKSDANILTAAIDAVYPHFELRPVGAPNVAS